MRARTKIFDRVTGGSRRRKAKNLLLSLILLALILTISLWIVIEISNSIGILMGFPWMQIKSGEAFHLLLLFILCFASSTLYIAYYRGIREVQKNTPLYLLVILIIVVLARIVFSF